MLFLLLQLAATEPTTTQDRPPPPKVESAPNVLFGEVLGNALLYSINYERRFEAWNIGIRGGASYFTYSVSKYGASGNLTLASFPIVASYYLGPTSHKIQLGLGATLLYLGASTDSEGYEFGGSRAGLGAAATAVLGYRYIPRARGVTFGVGFTPLLRPGKFLPWGGANVGYQF